MTPDGDDIMNNVACDGDRVFSEFRLNGIPYVFFNSVYSV
jgi:hypothetical protein